MFTPLLRATLLSLALTAPAVADSSETLHQKDSMMTKIQFTFGSEVLTATLDDTTAGRDFAAMLPLELELTDYHDTEKIADLPRKLDTTGAPAAYKPETGDITLYAPWGNLAIFYKPFRKSNGLVRLGAFDGSLAPLLKAGDTPVRIEIAE
ncbi:cyclophilin-like fold protein [Celeribacter ethanolicus]|uniref:cyclophilin-like fold protein n=1 Tax=Celeribacter ethanolicus TaxID=1758178 RepID=UPI001FCFECA6|nr:cyclophilin-like fold protein [Celeribacter ethanolicus]